MIFRHTSSDKDVRAYAGTILGLVEIGDGEED